MPKIFTSKTQKRGEIGEEIAVLYLKNKGFKILDRNYTRKWGEIDIVALKNQEIHFIEVKAVVIKDNRTGSDRIQPEENMHPAKLLKLQRTVETYLIEKKAYDKNWTIDLLCVSFNPDQMIADVKMYFNIV